MVNNVKLLGPCAVPFGSSLYFQVMVTDEASSRQGTSEIQQGKGLGQVCGQKPVVLAQVRRENVVFLLTISISGQHSLNLPLSLEEVLLVYHMVCTLFLLFDKLL